MTIIDYSATKALLDRDFGTVGTTVTNCIAHIGLPIDERPDDCKLCRADVRNILRHAIAANKWLNDWKDDAEKLLKDLLR